MGDLSHPFAGMSVGELVNLKDLSEFTFNPRVMQTLLELGWIEREIEPPATRSMGRLPKPKCSKLLAMLLVGPHIPLGLKAWVCRHLISADSATLCYGVLVPALVTVLERENAYLKTYATVALVNMTAGSDFVKTMLLSMHVMPVVVLHLRSKEDELVQYTLMLTTNLTKSLLHREEAKVHGIVEVVKELFTAFYRNPYRQPAVVELAGIIGQLCNEDDSREEMLETGEEDEDGTRKVTVLRCLVSVLRKPKSSKRLKGRVMFALRQLCQDSDRLDETVSDQMMRSAISEITIFLRGNPTAVDDFTTSAVMLLALLSQRKANVLKMAEKGVLHILDKLLLLNRDGMHVLTDSIMQMHSRMEQALEDAARLKATAQSSSDEDEEGAERPPPSSEGECESSDDDGAGF